MSAEAEPVAVTIDNLSPMEIRLIEAQRKIPADGGERYRRTLSIIEYVNALAEGMRSANV